MNKALTGFIAALVTTVALQAAEARWWKGNLHTHTLWSDGDDYPEMIVRWYKDQGYQFLALSDHNTLSSGQRWVDLAKSAGAREGLAKYVTAFGNDWVEQAEDQGRKLVRLKPLNEFRPLFDEAGKFLLIESEEVTDRHLTAPIHMNVTNLREELKPQGGSNVVDVMQRNVNAVLAQRERTGQAMFPHLNHPNFGWAVTAEELMKLDGEKFFEVYNGHPGVHNKGDATRPGTERMWDIILTWRLAVLNKPVMFGLGVDDSHNYHSENQELSRPGRGWVMVRAKFLTPEHIIHAMEAGDFYASSGVTLANVERGEKTLSVEIQGEPGVTYKTEFFGTKRGFDQANEPVRTPSGEALRVTHKYSPQVGEILATVDGLKASYTLKGDEIYVRARITSSKPKPNGSVKGEYECAWTQPVVGEAR